MENHKTYKRLVDYVRKRVMEGRLKPGDRLPTERELAVQLQISRNSLREGMRLLENIGIITSIQGSGNYLSGNFNETMAEMLSFMYFIKGMDEQQITEFRWAIEREALPLAIERITAQEKTDLQQLLDLLINAQDESLQIDYDRRLHSLIIHASRNDLLISSYDALAGFMDTYIQSMRRKIIRKMNDRKMLEKAHENLALGVIEGDLKKALTGLKNHYTYINL